MSSTRARSRTVGHLGYLSFRRSASRLVLTATGIALGVAVVFGVIITNDATTREVTRQVGGLTRPTIQVESPNDVPAAQVDVLSKLPDVSLTRATVTYDVASPVGAGRRVWVSGWEAARRGPAYEATPTEPSVWRWTGEIADEDGEVGMNSSLAKTLHAGIRGHVDLPTPTGPQRLTLAQVGRRRDGRAEDGDWAYTTVPTVRRLLGKGEVYTSVQVVLRGGVDERAWIARHREQLGALGAYPSDDATWKQQLREAARFGQASFAGAGFVAVFVGAFLIFLTLTTTVVERTRLYATLRALGASRRQVRRIVLTEALVLGILSSLAGLVLGLGAGTALVRLTARVYDMPVPPMRVPWFAPAASFVVGVVVTLLGAALPARRAARMQPIAAIRGSSDEPARLGRSWMAGVGLFTLGVAGTFMAHVSVNLNGAMQALMWAPSVLMLAGAVLMTPLVMPPVARVVGAITRRATRGVGDVAVMHLTKERNRSAFTLALVMVVLAMVFSIRAGQTSWRTMAERSMHHVFPADIGLYAGQRLTEEDLGAIAHTPGVETVTGIRWGQTVLPGLDGVSANLVIFDPASWFAIQGFLWATGDDTSARDTMLKGGSVLVPEGFALANRLSVGSSVAVDTLHGVRSFRVAGTYQGLDNVNRPRLFVSVADAALFGADDADAAAVRTARDADTARVSGALQRRFAARGDVTVFTSRQKGRELLDRFDRFVQIVYAVVFVAAVIGLLGMANTIAMSIYRRTREIGVLRAVGTRRRQVRAMVVLESATLAAAALVLAVPLGWIVSVSIVQGAAAATGGVFHYRFAWDGVPVLGAIAAAIAVLAAAVPARRAARADPVSSLRFE